MDQKPGCFTCNLRARTRNFLLHVRLGEKVLSKTQISGERSGLRWCDSITSQFSAAMNHHNHCGARQSRFVLWARYQDSLQNFVAETVGREGAMKMEKPKAYHARAEAELSLKSYQIVAFRRKGSSVVQLGCVLSVYRGAADPKDSK